MWILKHHGNVVCVLGPCGRVDASATARALLGAEEYRAEKLRAYDAVHGRAFRHWELCRA